jgi:hypothetical protein
VDLDDSGGWISAKRGEGGGGSSSEGGGWLSSLSATPLAPPERLGVKDLRGSEEEVGGHE